MAIEISVDLQEEAVKGIPFTTLEMTLVNGAQVQVETTPSGRVRLTLDRVGVLPPPLPLFLNQFGKEVATDQWLVELETIGAADLMRFVAQHLWFDAILDWVMQNTQWPEEAAPLGPGTEIHEEMDLMSEMKIQ